MSNIWWELPQGFFVLAPMDDVSDSVFRQLLRQHGAPDLFFTEFVAAEGVVKQHPHSLLKLSHHPTERPLIAQLWGADPQSFYLAARQISQQGGFDGIDINMGCPKRQLTGKGCCAALIRNPGLAKEIITACVAGAGELPVSVKTRIGWRSPDLEWLSMLLNSDIAALIIHYRLARPPKDHLNHPDYPLWQNARHALPKALADGPADFRLSEAVLDLRQRCAPKVRLVANGGIISPTFPRVLPPHDGWMIARAALQDPLFFAHARGESSRFDRLPPERQIQFALQHVRQHRAHYLPLVGEARFPLLKRFMESYLRTIPLLAALLKSLSYRQIEEMLEQHLLSLKEFSP